MKIILVFMLAVLFISCEDPGVFETEPVKLEKADRNYNGVFRLYQDFYNMPLQYQVNGTVIKISILNSHLFDISSHLFVVINYQNYSVMLYLDKPGSTKFIIPYYGTNDVDKVIIYAILTR